MVNNVLLRKLIRDLYRRKGSLITLVVIVAIGVGCYIGDAGVYRDLIGARDKYYEKYTIADFYIDLKRVPEWAVKETINLPNIRDVRGRVYFQVLIDLPSEEEPISGTAISMPYMHTHVINDIHLKSGTWFSGEDEKEVILNEAFARENGLYPGSRIKVMLLDKQHDLLVVGTAMSPEFVFLISPGSVGLAPDPAKFGVMYLPEKFLQESCDLRGAYNQIIGLAHDKTRASLSATIDIIERKMEPYGVVNSNLGQDQISVKYLNDELTGLKVSSKVMPSIFLVVAVLVLNVIMGRLVAQQRTIIGTLKALGYSSGFIKRHYLSYGVIIGLLGGFAGIAVGFWIQGAMLNLYRKFYPMPDINQYFYFDILFIGMGISIFFAVLGTLKGVGYSAKLEPAEAMRPPPPEKGHKVLPERIGFFWEPLPFRWKMILRAVFRNPFRSSVSVFSSIIATAIVFSALSMTDALDYLMAYEYKWISHQDITVALRDPAGYDTPSEILDLPTISQTESQLIVVCDLKNGPYEKRTGITGLVNNNHLYTPLDKNKNPISIPESGLILSSKLAEILNVVPGDKIIFRPLIGLRREVTAPVVGTVDTFLGLSAYANINYLSRLLGEQWAANAVLANRYKSLEEIPADNHFLDDLKKRPKVIGISERARAITQLNDTFGKTMGAMISIMVLFAGLIAFGSVLNASLVSLSERQREVGTLRVLGYTPRQVSGIFSGESFLLNIVGIIFGLGFGILLSYLLSMAYSTELYRFPAIILPSSLFFTAVIMFVFVSLAQVIIFRLIRKLEWLEVLKVKE